MVHGDKERAKYRALYYIYFLYSPKISAFFYPCFTDVEIDPESPNYFLQTTKAVK